MKLKNDKKKNLEKPKGKRHARTRLTVFLMTITVLIFILIMLSLRSPILELPVVTPTIVLRLAALTPSVVVDDTPETTVVDSQASPEGLPANLAVTATGSPTPYALGVALVVATDLRRGPGLSFPVVQHLASGARLTLVGANADHSWYLTGLPLEPAWIEANAINQSADVLHQLPIALTSVIAAFPTVAIGVVPTVVARASANVPVYTGPGLNYVIGMKILPGNSFEVMADSEDHRWYLISYFIINFTEESRNSRGQVWVQSSDVNSTFGGDVNQLPVIQLRDSVQYVTIVPLPTETATFTPSVTPTRTVSVTPTPSNTPTRTKTPTPSHTA